ncbi:MAG TPA: hypothetical protein DHW40_00800 [Microbacterium sp.]|nr:hypothetical protein [Microbacterium sp.]
MTRTAPLRSALVVLLAVTSPALAPVAASATDTAACTAIEAELAWDLGTSEFSASGGATQEDTVLRLTGGAGVIDPVGPVGSIAFEATVEFISDAGVATVLTNPTLVLAEESGQLLADLEPEGTALVAQAPLASVDLRAGAISEDGEVITATAVDATTERAADAVAFWSADPGELDYTITAECPPVESTVTPSGAPDAAGDDGGDGSGIWIGLGVGAAALIVVVLLTAGSIARRRRDAASVDAHTAPEPKSLPGEGRSGR